MRRKIANVRYRVADGKRRLSSYLFRRRVKNLDFSIISSNCWGSWVYRELGIQYLTPFVGLFLFAPDFIDLAENLEMALNSEMRFLEWSRYEEANEVMRAKRYPLAVIEPGVEIHFLHYRSEEEARLKWRERGQRVRYNNLFFSFTDRDHCTEDLLCRFERLPYRGKVCFTAQPAPNHPCCTWIPEFRGQPYVGDLFNNPNIVQRNFDIPGWLNGGTGRMTIVDRAVRRLLETP